MAAAAGKKESVSLSLFWEVNDLEVEEELSTNPGIIVHLHRFETNGTAERKARRIKGAFAMLLQSGFDMLQLRAKRARNRIGWENAS